MMDILLTQYNISNGMGEFLQEYHLYDEMSRLNNQAYFASSFEVNEVDQFLSSLTQDGEVKAHEMTLRIYLANFRKAREKSVYIVLKWLVCLHPTIEKLNNLKLIERIYDNLSKTETPRVEDRVDEFINEGIVRPYIHFLAKMCLVRIYQKEDSGNSQFNKENMCGKNSKDNLAFMKLNLARSVLGELVPTLAEMSNYFQTYYPLLTKIPLLLHRDVTNLLKDIRMEMKTQSFPAITTAELEGIQTQVGRLEPNDGGDDEYLSIEEGELSAKLSFFMESGSKSVRSSAKNAFD